MLSVTNPTDSQSRYTFSQDIEPYKEMIFKLIEEESDALHVDGIKEVIEALAIDAHSKLSRVALDHAGNFKGFLIASQKPLPEKVHDKVEVDMIEGFSVKTTPQSYINDLVVAKDSRGEGVGTALLLSFAWQVLENNLDPTQTKTPLCRISFWKDNEGAGRLYQRLGFTRFLEQYYEPAQRSYIVFAATPETLIARQL